MKVMVISIVVVAHGMISRNLENKQGEQKKTMDHPDHDTFQNWLETLEKTWKLLFSFH